MELWSDGVKVLEVIFFLRHPDEGGISEQITLRGEIPAYRQAGFLLDDSSSG